MAVKAEQQETKLIRTCSVWRSLEVVGDTATLLILESILWGDRRFDLIRERTGLQKALVSSRLKKLIDVNILNKRQYLEHPPRYEYVLSRKGRDLYWMALMMLRWERKWSSFRHGLRVELIHKTCGDTIETEPLCPHCKQVVHAKDVAWEEGPGVGMMAPIYSKRRRHRSGVKEESATPTIFTEVAELMGDRWCGLILRSVFTNLRRFEEILNDTAIASNILSERLTWLCETGILHAVKYRDNPERFEYRLTKKGQDYFPVLMMLQKWGDKYYVSPEGPPVILFHKTCGNSLDAFVGCSSCHEPIVWTDMEVKFLPPVANEP